jgi:hypothetical protein
MPRIPLTLLVANCGPFDNQASLFLDALGARAFPYPDKLVTQLVMTPSRLVVDAIVIDATTVAYLSGTIFGLGESPLQAAEMLVKDLRQLSPGHRMRNGVSWNDIPVFVLVDDTHYESFALHCRQYAPSVQPCRVPFRHPIWDEGSVPYGWDKIYDVIERRVKEWTFTLVERMQSQGWSLSEQTGSGQKYQSKKNDYDMIRLAPVVKSLVSGDSNGMVQAIKIMGWSTETVLRVLEYAHDASDIGKHVREYLFQRLFMENPYLLGAASFELVPHPHLVPTAADHRFPKEQIPDYVLHPFSIGNDADLRAIEIKRPDMRSGLLKDAAEQVGRTTDFINDPRYTDEVARVFGQAPRARRPLVIAGHSARRDFERFRASQDLADIQAYDEVFEQQERRYTFTPCTGLIGIYSNNGAFSPT